MSSPDPMSGSIRSSSKVRRLTAQDLELNVPASPGANAANAMSDNDPLYLTVRNLLDRFGGIILTGPPGTSKTYFAQEIANKLVGGDSELVRFVQFHPSYQYEDFVQGFVPKEEGDGFVLNPKHLIQMCDLALDSFPNLVVLVIDELSRGDPSRIFGEALTYVERSKRGQQFHLASGQSLSIPTNLVFICTMNPLDRGVDEVDAAFERRFAKVSMDPDPSILREFLDTSGMESGLKDRTVRFFEWVNVGRNRHSHLGHTYFMDAASVEDLERLWTHQLKFHFERAYMMDDEGLDQVQQRWTRVLHSKVEDRASGEAISVGDVDTEEEATPE